MNLTLQIHLKKGKHGGDGHCLESDYSLYLLKVETAYKSRDKGNLIYRLVSSNERLLKKEPDFFFLEIKNVKKSLFDRYWRGKPFLKYSKWYFKCFLYMKSISLLKLQGPLIQMRMVDTKDLYKVFLKNFFPFKMIPFPNETEVPISLFLFLFFYV